MIAKKVNAIHEPKTKAENNNVETGTNNPNPNANALNIVHCHGNSALHIAAISLLDNKHCDLLFKSKLKHNTIHQKILEKLIEQLLSRYSHNRL